MKLRMSTKKKTPFPYPGLAEELWNWEKNIAAVVHKGQILWLVDYKQNFVIDAGIDLLASYQKGNISEEKYHVLLESFRFGITVLNSNSIGEYLEKSNLKRPSTMDLRSFFLEGFGNIEQIELASKFREFGCEAMDVHERKVIQKLKVRLPSFYIDLDKLIYRHTDFDRFHDKSVGNQWDSEAGFFCNMISKKHSYWIIDDEDYSWVSGC